jgi:hypothetical protein
MTHTADKTHLGKEASAGRRKNVARRMRVEVMREDI